MNHSPLTTSFTHSLEFKVFEARPGIGVILLPDTPSYTIVSVSNDFVVTSGMKKANVVGKSHFAVFPENPADPQSSGPHSLRGSFESILRYKKPHTLPLIRYDIPNADGSFSEKYWKIYNAPVLNDLGEVVYIIHTAEDVTALIKAEQTEEAHQQLLKAFQKIEESEQKYRTLFESIDQGFCLVELIYDEKRQPVDHLFLEINSVFEVQTGLKDVSGKTARQVAPMIEGHWFQLYNQVVQTGKPLRFVEESKALNRWFELFVYPAGGAKNNRVAVLFADVTERKKAEKILRATKEKAERQQRLYETITANTPDLIYVFDLNYQFTYANKALLQMLGKTWEEAIGKGLLENGYEPWHAEMHQREIDQVIATRQPIRGEVFFWHATLGKRIYDYIFVPIINEKGEVEAVSGTTRDISDLKKAEELLRKSEQRQTFLLQLNDHLKTLADPATIQYEAARLVAKYLGADRVGYAEDGGDGVSVIVTTDYTNGLPSLKGKYKYDNYGPELLMAFQKGQTVVRSDIAADPTISKEEKAAHAALQLGATVNVPLLRGNKLIAIFFLHFREAHFLTEEEVSLMQEVAERTWEAVVRAKAEQALRESEERFRLMADAVPQSIWITDAEGRIEFLNKHWWNYCGEPYTDTTPADIAVKHLHPADGPKVLQAFETAIQTGAPFEIEQRNRSAEGQYRWFLNRGTPYRDPVTGKIVKWFGIGIDIHDRKVAEQALRQSEEALEKKVQERTLDLEKANQELKRSNANLEEFAYAASHDLKEPIRKIHFYTDHLKSRLDGKMGEEDIHYFERLEVGAKRMASLIDDLLAYSHIGRGISSFEPVDLNRVISLVREDLELTLKEKAAKITIDPLPVVQGHRRQLQQLFENLLGNALKYNKPGVPPDVTITATVIKGKDTTLQLTEEEKAKQYHLIEVKDNGIGFNQDDAERIFNVFTRLHGNSEYRGSGVGLSIVRKVMENHKGHVWAESTPDHGASFKITLPVD